MGDDLTAPNLEPINRLTRDIRQATKTLSADEARYLVDAYYMMQRDRIRSVAQTRTLDEQGEPNAVLGWLSDNSAILERNIKSALDAFSDRDAIGQWAKSITGIGPVIAAGLSAHIDITKAPTVGHIWRFAGLDPTVEWGKGKKRPWNASLKTLAWKIGESFVKVSNHERDVYGHVWAARKQQEIERNEAGAFAEQAAAKLAKFKIDKKTEAYKHYAAGKLPPGHIHARAKRYAVKLFLAHWHAVAYREKFGTEAPKPYVISQLHHAHEISCPNWPF